MCVGRGAPKDLQEACVVPVYKGRGNKSECGSYRGISMTSVVGKLYGRVLIDRVKNITDGLVGEEQEGFRKGRGCVDQVFAMKGLCEKYREKGKEIYLGFMDLEKAYDRIDREALWRVVRKYGVNGRLMTALKSFYVNSRAIVKVGGWMGEMFDVKVGLRQGCVMSPWLFNVYMDSIVSEVKRECVEEGLNLQSERGGLHWRMNMLLYADDTVLMGETEESLQRLVTLFNRECEKRKVRINGDKSKVMRVGDNGRVMDMGIRIGRVSIKQVECIKYLGVVISAERDGKQEFGYRLNEGNRALGGVRELWNRGGNV